MCMCARRKGIECCSSEGRKCSKYGVLQGICVYICRFTKVTGHVLSICVF